MLIISLFETIRLYLRYLSELSALDAIDDRLLRDIGLNRYELRAHAWETTMRGARSIA
jgi:uncharacterized protein YjiS (DUF1127 family)